MVVKGGLNCFSVVVMVQNNLQATRWSKKETDLIKILLAVQCANFNFKPVFVIPNKIECSSW